MKKIYIIIAAVSLFFGMAQCKKTEQIIPEGADNTVNIMLAATMGGSRLDVNTETGAVKFTEGDVIYVVSSGKYVGTLTNVGQIFTGSITNPTVGQPLYFYFFGNATPVTPTGTFIVGNTSSCTVVISDQSGKLPVISYARSKDNYSSEMSYYTAHLENQCALVKFDVRNASPNSNTCITGFNNKVTVNFAAATVTPSRSGEGVINLGPGNGDKWAILLPQDALIGGEAFSSDGAYVGSYGEVPPITNNDFWENPIEVDVNIDNGGKLRGKFKVNSSGKQVRFSKGNLQYIGSASPAYWKFAEEQYEFLGDNGQGSAATNVDRDLFGRGTSGYEGMEPYMVIDNSTSYIYDQNINNTNYDWGVYNAIKNGGNTAGMWRTATGDEFEYIFKYRGGIKYSQVIVNGIYGVVLLPDGWDRSIYHFLKIDGYTSLLSNPLTEVTVITRDEWKNILEVNGAVFLPAAGRRVGTTVKADFRYGHYWHSTVNASNTPLRYYYYFNNWIWPNTGASNASQNGFSVRLVTDVE